MIISLVIIRDIISNYNVQSICLWCVKSCSIELLKYLIFNRKKWNDNLSLRVSSTLGVATYKRESTYGSETTWAIGTLSFLGCDEDELLLSRCGFGGGKYARIKSCVRLNTK